MSKETDNLLGHPDVAKVIKAVFKDKGLRNDLDDAVGTVRLAAWAWTEGNRPATVAGWSTVCRALANNGAIDEIRKRVHRGKSNVGLVGDPDLTGNREHPAALAPLDVSRALAELKELEASGKLPKDTAEIVDGLQAGIPLSKIAEDAGLNYQRVRRDASVIRRVFGDRLDARGLGGLVAMAVIALIYFLRPRPTDPVNPIANHKNGPDTVLDAGAPPSPHEQPPEVMVDRHENAEKAAALIQEATLAFKKKQWEHCIGYLQAADALDAGTAVESKALHDACEEGMNRDMNSKGGRRGSH